MTAARAAAAFQMTVRVRLRMSIACPADGPGVMRLPGLGGKMRMRAHFAHRIGRVVE